jgi:ABC-type transporter Mla MlaB component
MFTATVSSTQTDSITLAIAGKVSEDALPQIALLIGRGKQEHEQVVLDLSEVTLLDPAAARFLSEQFRGGVRLVNCPVYIRRWITREAHDGSENNGSKDDESEK